MIPKEGSDLKVIVSGLGDTPEVAYIRLGSGAVHRRKRSVDGRMIVDYSRAGAVVGIELIGRVRVDSVLGLVPTRLRRPYRLFLRRALPSYFMTFGGPAPRAARLQSR